MEGLDDVKKELETKRQALAQELESALGAVASLEKDMKRVDEAIRALTKGGKPRTRRKAATAAPETPTGTGTSLHGHLTGATGFDPLA